MSQLDLSLMQRYQQQYEAQLSLAQPDWLKQQRLNAFNYFNQQGIPNTQRETWKYTPLRAWQKNNFYRVPYHEQLAELPELQLFSMLDEQCHDIVLVDGLYQPKLSAKNTLPLIVTNYEQAINTHESLLKTHLGKHIKLQEHPFASLCEALANQGLVLIVPDNTVIENPIHILSITTQNSENCANHLRNLWVIGKNAKVNIIEHYVDLNDVAYFNNIVTEVVLEENASLSHYLLEQEGHKSFHVASMQVAQSQGSYFNSNAVTLSGGFSRHDINTDLLGELARCELNGLYFTHNNQHVDYHTVINHVAPHCSSASLYKGILAESSVSVYNGKVVVSKGAQKTQAKQGNHNLLLSAQCEANSKPELEIYADDVKCAHGATTGQLDEEALFFLRARGLAESKARRMLIRAFANEIFNQMPLAIVREYCQRYLEMAAYE